MHWYFAEQIGFLNFKVYNLVHCIYDFVGVFVDHVSLILSRCLELSKHLTDLGPAASFYMLIMCIETNIQFQNFF